MDLRRSTWSALPNHLFDPKEPRIYGNLIQLSGDRTAQATWHRVPVGSAGDAPSISEATLQGILFRHADVLPLEEIDPAYRNPVAVCRELNTQAGIADALYLTPAGQIVLAEFKLWRNPAARREVIGQILDYARELASWDYDDLEREVRRRTSRAPFDIVSERHSELSEPTFIDNVARRLKRGEFLLLIIGDGIREGVEDIVAHVQEHSGLRFNLALVEAAIYWQGDREQLILQPRVLAKTELVPRTILVRRTILDESDDDPVEEHEPSPVEDENERFWKAVLHEFAFDDPEPEVPGHGRGASLWVRVEGSGHGGWGLSFGAFLNRGQSGIGTYFTWRAGYPEAERIHGEIASAVRRDEGLENLLPGCERWTNSSGQVRLGFRRRVGFTDGAAIDDFDGAVQWMREHFNRLVSALHPECRRRLRRRAGQR